MQLGLVTMSSDFCLHFFPCVGENIAPLVSCGYPIPAQPLRSASLSTLCLFTLLYCQPSLDKLM